MTITTAKKRCFEDFNVKFNEGKVEDLFQQYERIGFLYPEKKALLAPHFSAIIKNWKNLLHSKESLLWILTSRDERHRHFSSVSAWKQSNFCMQAQHLVSDGDPFLSLKVMLASQYLAEHHFTKNEINASQNWFRPTNRYAYRIFASMYDKLGDRHASLRLFHYLHLPLATIKNPLIEPYEAIPVQGINLEFINFVRKQYGEVFVRAEELNQKDILLANINRQFQQYGLDRYRKIVQFRCKKTRKIIAAVIVNRAPLGINFSFLENKAYYIVAENLNPIARKSVLSFMNATVKKHYQNFALQSIPIVTDALSASALESLQANFIRTYMQSIWMRSGFSLWFDHISSFLQKIEARQLSRQYSKVS